MPDALADPLQRWRSWWGLETGELGEVPARLHVEERAQPAPVFSREPEAGVGGAFDGGHDGVPDRGVPKGSCQESGRTGRSGSREGTEDLSHKDYLLGHLCAFIYGGPLHDEAPTVRTATYARVSTADQSPNLQHDGLRAFAGRAGLSVAAYADVAVSGRTEGRPDLDRLMASARKRELDHLGVRFVSVQDNVDTTSPMGRAMLTATGAMADLESAPIAERVQAGMAAAKARGRHVGRPATDEAVVERVEELARTTDLSARKIRAALAHERGGEAGVSRSVVGRVVKSVRARGRGVSAPSYRRRNGYHRA